jgi:hypothetical protein
MRRSTLLLGAVLIAPPLAGAPARAERAVEPLYTPSAFVYGFHGFLLGGGAGLGAGYLAGRAGGWHGDDWRALAYGAGVGALVGGGVGLGLGISDLAAQTPGRGYFVLRDGGYGLAFGAAAGTIAGGLGALGTRKGEHILLGTAIGGLAGTVAGLTLGIAEGQQQRRGYVAWVSVAAAPAVGGSVSWMPALAGRF